jgi:hypothetical protein
MIAGFAFLLLLPVLAQGGGTPAPAAAPAPTPAEAKEKPRAPNVPPGASSTWEDHVGDVDSAEESSERARRRPSRASKERDDDQNDEDDDSRENRGKAEEARSPALVGAAMGLGALLAGLAAGAIAVPLLVFPYIGAFVAMGVLLLGWVAVSVAGATAAFLVGRWLGPPGMRAWMSYATMAVPMAVSAVLGLAVFAVAGGFTAALGSILAFMGFFISTALQYSAPSVSSLVFFGFLAMAFLTWVVGAAVTVGVYLLLQLTALAGASALTGGVGAFNAGQTQAAEAVEEDKPAPRRKRGRSTRGREADEED